MSSFKELLHLPWRAKQPTLVTPPKPEPLVGKAVELWRVVHPKRKPDIKRSVIFGFDYHQPAQQTERRLGEKVFDRIMQANMSVGIDQGKPSFITAFSLNPRYYTYNARFYSEAAPPIPQDFESPISFKFSIWGCPTQEGKRPPLIDIIEIPGWRPGLVILGLGRTPDGGEQLFDLADLDQDNRPIWKPVYVAEAVTDYPYQVTFKTYVPESNLDWKRRFTRDVLEGFIEQYNRDLGVRETRREFRKSNLAYRRKFAKGLVEPGSIASAIHRRNPLILSFL